jgi:UDPglucose--hexose-1-phosphate uridylyltransferase
MSEIRYDKMHDTHVLISPERLHRPDYSAVANEKSSKKNCPFCEGRESMTPPEIFALRTEESFPNERGWKTRVVPNLYKAVQIETPHAHHYGLFEHWDGFGAHEVLIDTPEHYTSMTQWSEEAVASWLMTLRSRVADLRHDDRIVYISLFKNEGVLAGSTQEHSHTQIIGLPIIPKIEKERYRRNHAHYKNTGQAMLESMLLNEEEDGQRIIAERGSFTAFCPYASEYPFEVMISSKKAMGQIDTLSDSAIAEFAPLLLETLKKLKVQLGCFDFNLLLSTPPLQKETLEAELLSGVNEALRFSVRIMPRLYRHGGFEASTNMKINPVLPELAAKLLRESTDV